MATRVPPIAFLGVCDSAHRERNFDPRLSQLSLLRLRSEVVSHFYPLPLHGFQIILAVYDALSLPTGALLCETDGGKELFRLAIEFETVPKEETPPPPGSLLEFHSNPLATWTTLSISWPAVYPTITEPGEVIFRWIEGDQSWQIGGLHFLYAPAAPLSDERIAAIKSDPRATKSVRMRSSCTKCLDGIRLYAGLERIAEQEREGYIWYRDLPDRFRCKCGASDFSLSLIRENMHALMGQRFARLGGDVSFTRLYEQGSLQTLYDQFRHLLDRDPEEEEVQKFFEQNPVLLHIFGPEKIFAKAPILTKYKTDFVILSGNGQLRLVELERPGKRLLRRGGGRTAEFTQAFDQILHWQHELRDHRIAVLDSLGLRHDDITRVSGVVIIGRDAGYDRGELLRLKSADLGGVEFFTYDDLLSNLEGLIRGLSDL